MKKKVYIINGSGGKGKDTFVRYVSEKVNTMNVSSVDLVKEAFKILGWDGEDKSEEARYVMAEMKKLSVLYNNGPINYMTQKYLEFMESDYQVLFLHIREPKEIAVAAGLFEAKTILVKNDRVEDIKTNSADGGVYNYEYDIEIDNCSDLEVLKNKVVPDFLIEQKLLETSVDLSDIFE